jgi:transposase
MLLTNRKLLQSKAIAIENDLRGTLRNFGLKVGMVGKVKFEARIKELVENQPDLAELVQPLLIVRRALREQIVVLHRRLLAIVRDDEVCRRLMTTPGVGPAIGIQNGKDRTTGVVRRSNISGSACHATSMKNPAHVADRGRAILLRGRTNKGVAFKTIRQREPSAVKWR